MENDSELGIKVGDAELRAKSLPSKTVKSADTMLASICDIVGFPLNFVAAHSDVYLERVKMRLEAGTIKVAARLSQLPAEEITTPSDRSQRAFFEGVRDEDNPDLQDLWAGLLASEAVHDSSGHDPLAANILQTMSPDDAKRLVTVAKTLLNALNASSEYFLSMDNKAILDWLGSRFSDGTEDGWLARKVSESSSDAIHAHWANDLTRIAKQYSDTRLLDLGIIRLSDHVSGMRIGSPPRKPVNNDGIIEYVDSRAHSLITSISGMGRPIYTFSEPGLKLLALALDMDQNELNPQPEIIQKFADNIFNAIRSSQKE